MLRVLPQYCLELFNPYGHKIKACKTENKGRVVQGKHQSYRLSAASQVERDSWIDAIRWAAVLLRLTSRAESQSKLENSWDVKTEELQQDQF